ncbi:MAG: hypothetical protein ACFHU9_10745 [Fluviicola sp.]
MERVFKSSIKNIISFLCFGVLCTGNSLSQTMEKSNWLPIDCLDDTLYLQKYEPFTSHEIGVTMSDLLSHATDKEDTMMVQDLVLSGAEFFNLVLYRKINNGIDEVIKSSEDLPLIAVHKTDLNENINSNYRYVIRSTFTLESFDSQNQYRYGYHIYDIENDVHYRNYPTLAMLIESLSYSRDLKSRENTLSQTKLDRKLTDKALKPAKRKRNATRVLLGVCYAAFITLISIF